MQIAYSAGYRKPIMSFERPRLQRSLKCTGEVFMVTTKKQTNKQTKQKQ